MGRKLTSEEFIQRANLIHGFKYLYSDVIYTGYDDPVIIICPKHGEFKQRAHDHLDGCGCPRCAKLRSKAEIRLSEYIEGLGFFVINNSRKELEDKKELDIYIPSANVGIEFNGLRYHSSAFRGYPEMHRHKYEECKKSNIRLIQFYEDQWFLNRPSIFKTTSDVLFGRDIENIDLKDEVSVDLDIGIGISLENRGFELISDTGPIPYRVFNNFKNKERIDNVNDCKDPVIWLSGIQKWKKRS